MSGAAESRAKPGRRSPIRKWAGRLLLVTLSLGLTVFLVDRILTAFNLFGVNYVAETMRCRQELMDLKLHKADGSLDLDGPLFRHRPYAQAEFDSFRVEINSLGFRGPEIDKEKPDGTYRILALGDSVTFGMGVNDEVTYVRRLEKELNRQIQGQRFEVVNTGHIMYDTVQELAVLEREALALSPDLVILTYVVNDVDPSRDIAESYLESVAAAPKDPGAWKWLRTKIANSLPALRALHQLVWTPATVDDTGAADYLAEFLTKHRKRGWERSLNALLRIRDLCRENGIRLLVLDQTRPAIAIPDFCKANSIACCSLQFTSEEVKLPIYNSLCDQHSNAKGHDLLLQKLKQALREQGLFDLK